MAASIGPKLIAAWTLLLASMSNAGLAFAVGPKTNLKIGAIGDSITRGFAADSPLDNPSLSWSTGNDTRKRVESHLYRLQEMSGKNVTGFNVAKSGARFAEIPGQVAKLAEHKVDYATILIGANDLCNWGQDATDQLQKLQITMRQSITTLLAQNPDMIITLVPVPDMYNLWVIGKDSACQSRWDLLNICPRLLSSSASDEGRQIFLEQWEDVNEIYAEISREFSGNVVFAEAIANTPFAREDISNFDCFHPSIKGQNFLSETVWESSESPLSDRFGIR